MTKQDWQFVFDVLSSVASLVAIVAALVALYRSSRKPLRVYRTLIHRYHDKNKATIFLYVRNVKDYPVMLNTVDCYRQKSFIIQRDRGDAPEFSATFSGDDQVFRAKPRVEIPANADTHVELPLEGTISEAPRLLYLLDTSHGHHQVWCEDVLQVDVGKVTMRSAEYRIRLHSWWRAVLLYRWKKIVHAFRRSER